jgi:tripartite-type tricarboxylate transporter receptor subunit TctC
MSNQGLTRILGIASASLVSLVVASAAHSAGVEDFYKKRNMSMVIGYSSGGGYDIYARLLAKHMGRKIPGSPTLTPQNMPGAGSLKAASYLADVAARDGSVIGTFGRGIPLAPFLEDAKFDATKMTWIGSITEDVSLCLSWHTSKIHTWDDVLTKEYTVGGEGSTSDPDVFARLIKNVFNAKIKLVTGYPGTKDIGLAMERGEVDGLCGISYSTVKNGYREHLAQKRINILVQAALKKDPDLQNVPLLTDHAKPDQLEVLKLMLAPQVMARPIAAPPEVPADRRDALRKAFDDTMKDKDFLAEAKKMNLDINPTGGMAIEKIVQELYATPKDVIEKAKHAVRD